MKRPKIAKESLPKNCPRCNAADSWKPLEFRWACQFCWFSFSTSKNLDDYIRRQRKEASQPEP